MIGLVSGVVHGVQFVQHFEVRDFLLGHMNSDNCYPSKHAYNDLSRFMGNVCRTQGDCLGGLVDVSGPLVCALLKRNLGGC